MSADAIRIERPSTNSKLFAHTRWDVVPVAAGLFHFAYFLGLYFLYPYAPLWVMLILGFIYSLMINANVNGVSHNFIHNPFFRSQLLNRIFGVIESVACCFSQTYYDVVHMQHHKGNADRPDENGETIDWISIYKHGHDGEAENPWGYVFLSFFRDNPGAIKRELAKRGKVELRWGNIELAVFITVLITMAVIVPTKPIHFINWRFMLFFLPFFYLGHCFSYLNGYFRHYGANPDKPIAWGVSSTGKFITGSFSTTVITPNLISGRKCTGRKWKNFAKALPTYRNAKASAPSSERICLVFSITICQNVAGAPRTSKALRHQLLGNTRRLAWRPG